MRSITLFVPSLLLVFCLVSCEFKCSVGDSSTEKEKTNESTANKPLEKEGALIYNGVKVTTNKVKLSKAYLVERDGNGERIDEGNFVDIKTGVKLILQIDSGWVEKEGRSSIGASMKVVTESGEVVLEKEDMFAASPDVSAQDAKTIGLSVFFTDWKITEPVSLIVSFRVWDKNSDAFIEGSYTIHTK